MGQGITPIFDTEVERVKEQLAQADALRKMGLEGNTGSGYHGGRVFVVGNPLGNIASGLAGAFLGDRARTRQGELEQQQQTAREDWLGQMPSATVEKTGTIFNNGAPIEAPQATPAGDLTTGVTSPDFLKQDFTSIGQPPLGDQPATFNGYDPVGSSIAAAPREQVTVQAPVSPLQHAMEMQAWAMKAPRGMEGVQNFALQQALTAPQREAEAAQKAQDRLHELQLKAIDARATQAERLEAQKEIARMQIEGRQETARLVASLKASGGGSDNKPKMQFIDTVDEKGNPVKRAVDMNAVKPGDTFGKPAKAPTKAEEAVKKAMAAPGQIDQIMKEAELNKDAFGIIPAATTMLPNIVGSRLMSKVLTEDQQKARIKVQTQAAKVIHDVYGAALSRNEAFRAEGWAPDPRDDYESTMRKLQGAKEYSQMLASEKGGSPAAPAAPAGGMSDDDLLKKYGSGK